MRTARARLLILVLVAGLTGSLSLAAADMADAATANVTVSPVVDSLLLGSGDVTGRHAATTRLELQKPDKQILCPSTYFGSCSPAATVIDDWVKRGASVVIKYTNTQTRETCLSSDSGVARISPYSLGPNSSASTHFRIQFKLNCGKRGEDYGSGPEMLLYFTDKAPAYSYMLSAGDVAQLAQRYRTDADFNERVCNLGELVETVDNVFTAIDLGKAAGEGVLEVIKEFEKSKLEDLIKTPPPGVTSSCDVAKREAAAAAALEIEYGAMRDGGIGYLYASDTYSSGKNSDSYSVQVDNPANIGGSATRISLISVRIGVGRNGFLWLQNDGPVGATYIRSLIARYDHRGSWSVPTPTPIPNPVSDVTVATDQVPLATTGSSYSFQLLASGGMVPIAWSISTGSLPDGLSLDSAGAISGTTTVDPGNFPFTVNVVDKNGARATKALTIGVVAGPLTFIPPSDYVVLSFYCVGGPTRSLAAYGGKKPYAWSVIGGTLPPGVTFSPDGVLALQPEGRPGDKSTVTVQVTDAAGVKASAAVNVAITACT